jgi:hypothetical protein
MVSGGAVPPPRILNCILVPHRIIKAGVYPQNTCGNTPAIFLKKKLATTNKCNGFNGAAHPLCGFQGLLTQNPAVFVEIDDIFDFSDTP